MSNDAADRARRRLHNLRSKSERVHGAGRQARRGLSHDRAEDRRVHGEPGDGLLRAIRRTR